MFEYLLLLLHIYFLHKHFELKLFELLLGFFQQVDEYFERVEINEGKKLDVKRVYVASDDAKVLAECIKKFPGKKTLE